MPGRWRPEVPRGWRRHGALSRFDSSSRPVRPTPYKRCLVVSRYAVSRIRPKRRIRQVGRDQRAEPWPACPGMRPCQACRHGDPRTGRLMVVAWSTFGPHPIGTERFIAVSSGTSFAQVTGAILGEQAQVENLDKDEVPGSSPGRPTSDSPSSRPSRPIIGAGFSGRAARFVASACTPSGQIAWSLEIADAAGPIGRFRWCQGCRCSSRRSPRHHLRCRS
jgi:hypothetical protein